MKIYNKLKIWLLTLGMPKNIKAYGRRDHSRHHVEKMKIVVALFKAVKEDERKRA